MGKFIKLICRDNTILALSKKHIVAICTRKEKWGDVRLEIVLSTGDIHVISNEHHTLESILNQLEDENN